MNTNNIKKINIQGFKSSQKNININHSKKYINHNNTYNGSKNNNILSLKDVIQNNKNSKKKLHTLINRKYDHDINSKNNISFKGLNNKSVIINKIGGNNPELISSIESKIGKQNQNDVFETKLPQSCNSKIINQNKISESNPQLIQSTDSMTNKQNQSVTNSQQLIKSSHYPNNKKKNNNIESESIESSRLKIGDQNQTNTPNSQLIQSSNLKVTDTKQTGGKNQMILESLKNNNTQKSDNRTCKSNKSSGHNYKKTDLKYNSNFKKNLIGDKNLKNNNISRTIKIQINNKKNKDLKLKKSLNLQNNINKLTNNEIKEILVKNNLIKNNSKAPNQLLRKIFKESLEIGFKLI